MVHSGSVQFKIDCGFVVHNPITVPASDISDHLGRMFGCADGSDVSFSVGGDTFHAHRTVLAARSPVFKSRALRRHGRGSNATHHGARDRSSHIQSSAVDVFQHLLAAADRYALDRLKLLCAHKLWDNVSADAVADVLACAETYSCQELKDSCMDFLVEEKNFKQAMLTAGFVRLGQRFPFIIAELRKKAGI